MFGRLERGDLFAQLLSQLATGADLGAGNVVDRLVGIQLHALATAVGQCVDQMRMNSLQAQLKDLKQADRARADDDRIGVDRAGRNVG